MLLDAKVHVRGSDRPLLCRARLLDALPPNTPLILMVHRQALVQLAAYYGGSNDNLFRISFVLLCFVAWRNRQAIGGKPILAGLVLNAVSMLVLGRMPISPAMLARGQHAAHIGQALTNSKDVVIASSPLLVLGDTLPLALGGWRAAWSVGDAVLLLRGAAVCPHPLPPLPSLGEGCRAVQGGVRVLLDSVVSYACFCIVA